MRSEDVKWCIHFGKQYDSSSSGETKLSYDTTITLLLKYSIEIKTYVHIKTLIQMIIATLIIRAKRQKQCKCLSTNEWINKIWGIHAMQYYLTAKKK